MDKNCAKNLKHSAIPLVDFVESFEKKNCIIFQKDSVNVLGSERGWNTLKRAASIRNDEVTKRIKTLDEADDGNFVYHMTNDCYKKYTLKKSQDFIQTMPEVEKSSECGL